jgi:hypothetical protein
MQNDFVQEGAAIEIPRARAMVPRLNRLLDVCRTPGALRPGRRPSGKRGVSWVGRMA